MNKSKAIIAIIILIIDQITKSLMQINNANINIIEGFLKLKYYQNTGAAWSILEGYSTLLIVISVIILILLFNMMYSYEDNKINNISFGLLVGGILGNLADRIFCSFVRDFIAIKIFSYQFPVFNIADISIVIGVLLLVFSTIKGEIKNGNKGQGRALKNR